MCAIGGDDSSTQATLMHQIFFNALPTISGTVISIICYVGARDMIIKIQKNFLLPREVSSSSFLWYPLTSFATTLPAIIYYYIKLSLKAESDPFLEGATMLISHSQGLVNALVYGYQARKYRNKAKHQPEQELRHESNDTLNWDNLKDRFDEDL